MKAKDVAPGFFPQVVFRAERLPREVLRRRRDGGPLVRVGDVSDVRADPALLPVSTHRAEIRRVLRESHENPEKGLQVRFRLFRDQRT